MKGRERRRPWWQMATQLRGMTGHVPHWCPCPAACLQFSGRMVPFAGKWLFLAPGTSCCSHHGCVTVSVSTSSPLTLSWLLWEVSQCSPGIYSSLCRRPFLLYSVVFFLLVLASAIVTNIMYHVSVIYSSQTLCSSNTHYSIIWMYVMDPKPLSNETRNFGETLWHICNWLRLLEIQG